ncbi:hypothetical protein Lfu02_41570 [Longispora fulva]|uniref:Uncharacterized protein n=1 Tax=Longispora fulva TaxID=619741 RepID=A0A8J7GF54_9ACTN|nr:hypothetical protein [Longispora fulva]MBG6136616.1 hypothetical protein [Longispora fulva]GIG59785.1 hypothetical protein Lfu02_41570 [Longispora fulva]
MTPTEPDPPAARRRAMWPLTGLALCAVAVVVGAVLWNRPSLAVAGVAGAAAPVLAILMRRHWKVWLTALGVLGFAGCALGLLYALFWGHDDNAPAKVSVPYRAHATVDGDTLRITEEVTVDNQAVTSVTLTPGGTVRLDGWVLDHTLDTTPVYARSRTLPLRGTSPVSSAVEVPIALGWLTVNGTSSAGMVPRTGSTFEVSAPKGALSAVVPHPQQVADGRNRTEVATVALDSDSDAVTATVLVPVLRNPAGHALDSLFAWGPLAWCAGAAFALLSLVLVKRLTDTGDAALGRLFRRGRPQQPPSPETPGPTAPSASPDPHGSIARSPLADPQGPITPSQRSAPPASTRSARSEPPPGPGRRRRKPKGGR